LPGNLLTAEKPEREPGWLVCYTTAQGGPVDLGRALRNSSQERNDLDGLVPSLATRRRKMLRSNRAASPVVLVLW
jgi:hypothetical protein